MNVDRFISYLKFHGIEVLPGGTVYEIVRFRSCNGISSIYKNKKGRITFTGDAKEAYDHCLANNIWQIAKRDEKERVYIQAQLYKRDGPNCFYCGKETVKGEDRTVEHLLSLNDGGNNNLSNLVIACEPCNKAVGSKPIIEKVKFREKKHNDKC
jgi:hypothetical protein